MSVENKGINLATLKQEVYAVKVAKYLGLAPEKGLAIIGQPVPQYYFYRPLHALFNACFRAGFVMDGIEEPGFGPQDAGTRWFSWANFKEISPVLVMCAPTFRPVTCL